MKPYQLMGRLVRYRPWLYFFNGLLWVGVHTLPIVPGLIARSFFDALPGKAKVDGELGWLLVLLVVAALTRILCIIGGMLADVVHRFATSGLLRRNLLARVLELPGAAALQVEQGEALNRFRDDAKQVEDTIDWTLDLIGTAVFAITAITVLMLINTRITVLVFLPLTGVVLLSRYASSRVQAYRKAAREATGQVTGAIGEVFGAVQAVQLAGAEERVVEHLHALNDVRRLSTLKEALLLAVTDSVMGNLVSLGTGLILLLAARAMESGTFTVGDFALFSSYLLYVTDFTALFGNMMIHYKQAAVALERLQALARGASREQLVAPHPLHFSGPLPAVAQPVREPDDRLAALEVRGLTCRHGESGRGVVDVDLRLERGSFTVVTGRIGSGKSTLVRALLGLLPLEYGTIRWNGRHVADPATFFTPPRCAYTPQVPVLFSDTVQGNLLLGLEATPLEVSAAVERAVLDADLAGMEHGLQTMVGARGVKLSGGQIQRLAAARMFVRQPELLVFDDLSSALDLDTERQLWERTFQQADATCLVVSHRRAALHRADQILVLKDGRVVDRGRLEELLERCAEMRELWRADAAGGPMAEEAAAAFMATAGAGAAGQGR
jgi:ATP-binding cassette, subfamily B, bacterial